MDEQEQQRQFETMIRAAANVVIGPVLELIQRDNHSWSERPCGTCRTITTMLGQPFGCYLHQQERAKRRAPTGDGQS